MRRAKSIEEALSAGILFVALNDDPDIKNVKVVADTLSVVALSAAFGISARIIAKAVVSIRKNSSQ